MNWLKRKRADRTDEAVKELQAKVRTLEETLAARVRRLRLRAGDVAVLELDRRLPHEAISKLKHEWLMATGVRAVVLDPSVRLSATVSPATEQA